jgi:two-component system sensor histidine kinase KdpD
MEADAMRLAPEVQTRSRVTGFIAAAASVLVATLVAWLFFGRDQLPDVVMLYLLAVVVVSMRFGHAASMFATLLAVCTFDVVFVPPHWSFAVSDFRHLVPASAEDE